MANKDNSERIERYLREQMTPEENEVFLNDLRKDKELREEAQMMALLIKEMKEEQAKQDEAIAKEILASKEKSTAKTIRLVKWIGSIAAMFIILFGATTLWNRHSDTEALFEQYYETYEMNLEKGGDDGTIKKELAELYNKVGTEKDITPIIARLQTIYDGIQSNSDDYADYSYYENDIAWYLALAYIKDNNLDKARELLKQMKENGNEEVGKMIEELNKVE